MDKLTLIKNLKANKKIVLDTLSFMTEAQLNESKGEKWTNAGHIEHLIKSIRPLNTIFLFPKVILRVATGKPNRKSRTYDELVAKYWEKLKLMNPRVNRFGPKGNKKFSKTELINQFDTQYDKLANEIAKNWDEESLENYIIPHPLIGKLTVREMIMFTIYHTLHHHKALNIE